MSNSDMYNTFSDVNFQFYYPFSFEKENKDYITNKNKAKYKWNYGDTVYLVFGIQGLSKILDLYDYNSYDWTEIYNEDDENTSVVNIPANNVSWDEISNLDLSDYTVIVYFYNFRFELIYQQPIDSSSTLSIDDPDWVLTIDKDTSADIFKKGTYYCEVKLYRTETPTTTDWVEIGSTTKDADEDTVDHVITVVNAEDCLIYVK